MELLIKYKADLIAGTEAKETKNGVKIVPPLKYLGNFWRSLKIPLIKPFIKPSLRWIENYVLTTTAIGANADATGADGATFNITEQNKNFCSCCYFISRRQCKIKKTIRWRCQNICLLEQI